MVQRTDCRHLFKENSHEINCVKVLYARESLKDNPCFGCDLYEKIDEEHQKPERIELSMHHMDLFKIFVWIRDIKDRNDLIKRLSDENDEQIKSLDRFIRQFITNTDKEEIEKWINVMVDEYSHKPYIKKRESYRE